MRLWLAIALCLVGGPAAARQQDDEVFVNVRVSALEAPGTVQIDRGAGSRLEVDDLVRLLPRDGLPVEGVIVEVLDRSALVRLYDAGLSVPVGTRGTVLVPMARLAADSAVPPGDRERDPSRWQDDGWREGMPLLAGIEAVDPAERVMLYSGRAYLSLDQTWTTDRRRKDSFYRAGAAVAYENPFGRGGTLNLDAEYNYRATHAPDMPGEDFTNLRLDRVSYRQGGTRFDDESREFGRFLQSGMPEFGVLDGVEWGRRRENGDRYGFSAGFMPEPTPDFQTGQDFQVAGFYEYHPPENDAVVLTGGFQRTFHSRQADRDLLVGKISYQPVRGWDFHGTLWLDLYGNRDDEKPLIEISHLYAVANRRYGDAGAMRVSLRHFTFPQLERFEFLPVLATQLGHDHMERLAWSGWRRVGERSRLHGQAGFWLDEDELGGDGEIGYERRGLFREGSRADLTGFVSLGEFSRVAGLRAQYDWRATNGRWRVFYSIENQENVGFDVLDQLIQHWLRFGRNFQAENGWSLDLRGETLLFGDESSWSLGAYLQRSF